MVAQGRNRGGWWRRFSGAPSKLAEALASVGEGDFVGCSGAGWGAPRRVGDGRGSWRGGGGWRRRADGRNRGGEVRGKIQGDEAALVTGLGERGRGSGG